MTNDADRRADWDVSAPPAFALERLPAPPEVLALRLAGELDVATSDELREQFEGAGEARAIVLDLAEVVFMDSSTLRELLRAQAGVRERGGVLVLAAAQPAVVRLLELTGTGELFVRAETREDALSAARAAPL